MEIISTTINFKGCPVKIENRKVYLRAFGTSIHNHSRHWSWMEVEVSNLKLELRDLLKTNKLI